MPELLLTADWHNPESHTINAWLAQGGYEGLRRTRLMDPAAVIDEVKKSALRGRGGARFSTGMKWSFVPRNSGKPVYLAVNADEGEPGTFKDRHIMEKSPHALVEGAAIAAYAIGAREVFVYIRGEYAAPAGRVGKAISEAEDAGFIEGLKFTVVQGAGAYICGEETALLSSVEGKKGFPKLKPPFPAVSGLYRSPTVINNVETLAYLPFIMVRGGDWFASLGTPKNGGMALYCVSGHVNRPGVYELPMGVSLRELIESHARGIRGGGNLRAVFPGGSSSAVLAADEVDVKMDSESLASAGSMLGSGAVIVMDDTVCMASVARNLADFYAHESCGQCTPCREGTDWMSKLIQRLMRGRGRPGELDMVPEVARMMVGRTICALADAAAIPLSSLIAKFRGDFEAHIAGQCPRCPKISGEKAEFSPPETVIL